jgi:hypothetical protein
MNTAGGPVQGDEAWPLPPLALPRGLREHAWHAALLVSLLLPIALPPLRAPTFVWAVLVSVVSALTGTVLAPWAIRRVALVGLALAVLAGRLHLERAGVAGLLRDMLLRREDLTALEPLVWITVQGWLWVTGLLIVATVTGFDLRVAHRQVADERLWARQQARRRQVMAQRHRRNPPPETL